MEYIVQTSGTVEVLEERVDAYVVEADSQEEAYQKSKELFKAQYGLEANELRGKATPRDRYVRISFVLLLISFILAAIPWTRETKFLFFSTGSETIVQSSWLKPTILATAFYSAFVVRYKGIARLLESKVDIFLGLMVILTISAYFRIFLTPKTLLIFINIDPFHFLVIAVLAAWFGIKGLGAIMLALVMLMSIHTITQLGEAIPALLSISFVLSSFFGFLTFIYVEPAFYEALPLLKSQLQSGMVYLKEDAEYSRNIVSKTATVAKVAVAPTKVVSKKLLNKSQLSKNNIFKVKKK